MPAKSYAKWNIPKHWRVRGTAADGLTVTLGRYETKEEADADFNRLTLGGMYRDLVVQPLEVKPVPEAPPRRWGGAQTRLPNKPRTIIG